MHAFTCSSVLIRWHYSIDRGKSEDDELIMLMCWIYWECVDTGSAPYIIMPLICIGQLSISVNTLVLAEEEEVSQWCPEKEQPTTLYSLVVCVLTATEHNLEVFFS